MRITVYNEPFNDLSEEWINRGDWPAKWIGHPMAKGTEPTVTAYRRSFSVDSQLRLRIHVSADQRYELFLDGERIGRGPERGDRENWFYESYELGLATGDHVLVARTWWLQPDSTVYPAPCAQMTVRPAFVLASDGACPELVNTGVAPWDCKLLGGYSWVSPVDVWGTGAKVHINGSEYPWGFEAGRGDGWVAAEVIDSAVNASIANDNNMVWRLRPSVLPQMLDILKNIGNVRHVQSVSSDDTKSLPVRSAESISTEKDSWNLMIEGKPALLVPANTIRRVIIDLGNYFTAYPVLKVSGGNGSLVRILWAEGLYEEVDGKAKGNRNEIEGKYFGGIGDTFEPDGGESRVFEPLWWEAGRYVEVFVRTAEDPLTVENIQIRETRYPYDNECFFEAADTRLAKVFPVAYRTIEMCSHETYMDCPYYEQMMYVGDTRLQALVTYTFTHDDRLPRKAIRMFDASRINAGITQSRYPSYVTQIIPPFSLWWVGMVYDYAMWRDDVNFIRDMMPGVRGVLDAFRRWINSDGLVEAPNGWNFMDWVSTWGSGIPPGGDLGVSGVINWQMVHILRLAAELEEIFEEHELAARNRRTADAIAMAIERVFWDNSRGLYADDTSKSNFSEHAQCLALLSGILDDTRREQVIDGLLNAPDLARTTIYFTHYLFETYRSIGRIDAFFERMPLWFDLLEQGFCTFIEHNEPSRSDCHAWSSHPIYHYFASVLGIRPSAPGFSRVRIEPQLGTMPWAKGTLPHPKGFIKVDFRIDGDILAGTVELPEDVYGTLVYGGMTMDLRPGEQNICCV